MNQSSRIRIDALTSTRAFAALLVVIYHFGRDVFPFDHMKIFFGRGNIAVSYFFVLSGFVMSLTYMNEKPGYAGFIKRRVARIAPAYYLALSLTILPFLFFHYVTKALPLEDHFFLKLFLNVFFLQAYVPGYALSLNSPGWSLSVEFFFYFLFPVLLVLMKKNRRAFFIGGVIVFVVSQVIHVFLANRVMDGPPADLFQFAFYNPLLHLNEFLLGMAGSLLYIRWQHAPGLKNQLLLPAALLLTIAMIRYTPNSVSLHDGLMGPVFLLLILAVAINDPAGLRIKPLVFLGEISYGIYILQAPVWYYMLAQLNLKLLHLNAQAFFYFYLVALVAVATGSYYFIEKPCRKRINALSLSRPNAVLIN